LANKKEVACTNHPIAGQETAARKTKGIPAVTAALISPRRDTSKTILNQTYEPSTTHQTIQNPSFGTFPQSIFILHLHLHHLHLHHHHHHHSSMTINLLVLSREWMRCWGLLG
jgi:hypothetical protein